MNCQYCGSDNVEAMDELTGTIARIRELEEEQAAISAELDALKGQVKDFMKANGVKSIEAGKYKVTYSEYSSNRFDSTRFKAEHPSTYASYLKATPATRLTISLRK